MFDRGRTVVSSLIDPYGGRHLGFGLSCFPRRHGCPAISHLGQSRVEVNMPRHNGNTPPKVKRKAPKKPATSKR